MNLKCKLTTDELIELAETGKVQLDGFNSNVAVIGFDTAHFRGEEMTANDVRKECFSLIEQIESLKMKRYCNQCGAQVEPDFNFCEICGQKLAKESEE